jgi:mono/diheme cytochrome c family protein
MLLIIGFACLVLVNSALLSAAESNANSGDALTLLEKHCVSCHNDTEKKGSLDLSTREALVQGGQSGDVIDIESPTDSYLIQTVRHEIDPYMPFKKPKLSDADIEVLVNWMASGAKYDRKLKAAEGAVATRSGFEITETDRSHWAFQPVVRPPLPEVDSKKSKHKLINPIDHFILAKLQEKGLDFSPEVSRETLIRRVTLDMIGLPPTPAEIDDFIGDTSPDAYERLIDRLLASPHYGERWGRHWLDLARYAETDGFEHDAVRPNSWRYRDYVIKAFNEDKPYDRFIREQLAGDELWPDDIDAIIATGFNLLGPDMVDSSDQVQRRLNTLNDMTDTTSLVFLGLTMGCARCHDHKFEPISQKDYYSFQAHFTSAEFDRDCLIASKEELKAHELARNEYHKHPAVRELQDLEKPVREKVRQEKMAMLSPEAMTALQTPPEKRTVEQKNLALESEPLVDVSIKEMVSAMDDEVKARREQLLKEVKKVPAPPQLSRTAALTNGQPAKTFVLHRGEYTQPGDEVQPRCPEVLESPERESPEPLSPSQEIQDAAGCRTELADWIASPENPLTARVMVNRIWRQHFGHGIVGTPSNFGTHGLKPTHPELLDWLASEFMARGWSMKQLHRLMLTSRTYRQVSSASPKSRGMQVDRENTLYWRMNRLRLEGEAIRDSLLAVSGQLNPAMGGPGVFPPLPAALFKGSKGWKVSPDERDHVRRSVYIFARRNLRFPFLEVFDAPDNNLSCPAREQSTTAPQSLTLLNSEEVVNAADALAKRLEAETKDTNQRITRAYRLTLGRKPTSTELAMSQEFLADSPLSEFCRALFNLNDFVYVE